jgi:hypothetical protein
MSDHTYRRKMGGEVAHVGDCYVWAEIHYLDSSTDYREFLPVPSAPRVSGQLLMLDLDDEIPRPRLKSFLVGAALVLQFLFMLACWRAGAHKKMPAKQVFDSGHCPPFRLRLRAEDRVRLRQRHQFQQI